MSKYSPTKVLILLVVTLIGFATAYVATSTIAGGEDPLNDGPRGEADPSVVSLVNDGLGTSNREYLGICVEQVSLLPTPSPFSPPLETGSDQMPGGSPTGASEAAADMIREIIPELETHWAWVDWNLSRQPPQVVAGCGATSAVYESIERGEPPESFYTALPRKVEVPSVFRLHVFILDPAELERFGGPDTFRLATEETICGGDVCSGVTTGLYLTEDEASDKDLLSEWIKQGIGLE